MINVYGGSLRTEDLKGIEVRRPGKAGNRWRGVKHHDLARAVEAGLHERDIDITKSVWALSNDQQDLFGGFDVTLPDRYSAPDMPGMTYALGIRSSNALRYSITMAVGARVMVCSNGMITGEFVLAKKHTLHLNLNQAVNQGLERWTNEIQGVAETVKRLKEMRMPQRKADHCLCEAGRQRLLPWSHLGIVEKEFRNPRHEEFKGRSAWSLYSAMSEVLKRSNPQRQMRSLHRFRELLLN